MCIVEWPPWYQETRRFPAPKLHILKGVFQRVVKEVALGVFPDLRFQSFALLALQVRETPPCKCVAAGAGADAGV
jgi:hypothetical protein